MDQAYECAKSALLRFKLERCCCLAPIRVGLLIVGYFNLFISVLSLVGTADGGITAPLMEVQEAFLEDNASKPVGILAYSSELAFSIVLLCAMYRNDRALLRVYVWFVVAEVTAAVLVYSMVIVAMSLLTKMVIIGNIVFNVYVILLVRSAIVEIKENSTDEQNGHVTLYSLSKYPEENKVPDIEAEPAATVQEITTDEKTEETQVKLETVSENSKEN